MKLQYTTDCALLMMVYLTGEAGRIVSSRELEKMIHFPQQSIFNAGRKLKNFGFINTINGPFGGYMLAKSPDEISIQDILEAFKDEFYINGETYSEKAATTTLQNFARALMNMEAEMKQKMSAHTLAELLAETV